MCVTTEPSSMSNTILYGAQVNLNGVLNHVLGYQNKAETNSPNAMLLPIPSAKPLGPKNVHDMTKCPALLDTYAAYLKPQTRALSLTKGVDFSNAPVQIFDSGSYTVVLATDPAKIVDALDSVPANKRPRPNKDIFDAYAGWYPGWHVALCCYADSIKAEPLVWSYEPLNPDVLFLPGLDAHDGKVPNLSDDIVRDHSVIYHIEGKNHSHTMIKNQIPNSHSGIFKPEFSGWLLDRNRGRSRNGDFVINTNKKHPYIEFAMPPGAPAKQTSAEFFLNLI